MSGGDPGILDIILAIPGYAILVWLIIKQEKRMDKKDEYLQQLVNSLVEFSSKFEKMSTLLEELIHRDGGGHV